MRWRIAVEADDGVRRLDEAEIIEWVIQQASRACRVPAELIIERPRSVPRKQRLAAAQGMRVAACVLRRLGLSVQKVCEALSVSPPAVHSAIRNLRNRREDLKAVQSIIAHDDFERLRAALARTKHDARLAERMERLEERVLRLESTVRSISNPDFRRLDALILAGWGDVPQDKIPLEVLVRALLGLKVPSIKKSPARYGDLTAAISPSPEC
jgi:predicted transcriptional regulator